MSDLIEQQSLYEEYRDIRCSRNSLRGRESKIFVQVSWLAMLETFCGAEWPSPPHPLQHEHITHMPSKQDQRNVTVNEVI